MKRLTLGRWQLIVALLFTPLGLLANDANKLIEGGKGIGKVFIGMRESQMIDLLGKPSYKDAIGDSAWDGWHTKPGKGPVEETYVMLESVTERHQSQWFVRQIVITSPFFHTRAGITTKSDLTAIWQEFPDLHYATTEDGGDGSRLELYDSIDEGIAFMIERTKSIQPGTSWGKCRGIIVHHTGERAMFDRIGKFRRQM